MPRRDVTKIYVLAVNRAEVFHIVSTGLGETRAAKAKPFGWLSKGVEFHHIHSSEQLRGQDRESFIFITDGFKELYYNRPDVIQDIRVRYKNILNESDLMTLYQERKWY